MVKDEAMRRLEASQKKDPGHVKTLVKYIVDANGKKYKTADVFPVINTEKDGSNPLMIVFDRHCGISLRLFPCKTARRKK